MRKTHRYTSRTFAPILRKSNCIYVRIILYLLVKCISIWTVKIDLVELKSKNNDLQWLRTWDVLRNPMELSMLPSSSWNQPYPSNDLHIQPNVLCIHERSGKLKNDVEDNFEGFGMSEKKYIQSLYNLIFIYPIIAQHSQI